MKLLRYGALGTEKTAMLDAEGQIRDLSKVIADVAGVSLNDNAPDELRAIAPTELPLVIGNPHIAGLGVQRQKVVLG